MGQKAIRERDEARQQLIECIRRLILGSIEEGELWYLIDQYADACVRAGTTSIPPPEETPLGEALDQGIDT